ncbi:MAG: 2-isopropylmalate synthase, partial [Spirosomaceae bacterium]|nr:2-isopropylmalate synthase [Spirosomataceae bacterium]
GIDVNIYLEDWSNGMRNSKEYVFQMLDFLVTQSIKRVLFPDTLGILTPRESYDFCKEAVDKFPNLHFDFHGHNDYDLGVANVMEAIRAGVHGVHLTVNGMGERAGNAPLSSTVAVINDFMPEITTGVNEQSLYTISKLVETFSGIRVPNNKPIVGENVFTQTAGIHADGDKKNNLYFSKLSPQRFGRKRTYALGKTSGKANIEQNLQELGITLSDVDIKKVTQRIIELGDKKQVVTQDDLPYIISDVLDNDIAEATVEILNYVLTHSKELRPSATVKVRIRNKVFEEHAQGDGQYDAFMNALRMICEKEGHFVPTLTDYAVRIPPGGETDALCETIVSWKLG